jgi:hypothetical protein
MIDVMTPHQKATGSTRRKVILRLAVAVLVGVTMSLLALWNLPAEVRFREITTVILVIVAASLTSYALDKWNKARFQRRRQLRLFVGSSEEVDTLPLLPFPRQSRHRV